MTDKKEIKHIHLKYDAETFAKLKEKKDKTGKKWEPFFKSEVLGDLE
jgi:hypothetical protein